jgi:glycosyltransferase involved in cell wall biosynthesis
LKIGVDARALSSPITGIGQYTLQILQHLDPNDHQWFLYSHQKLLTPPAGQVEFTIRTADLHWPMLGTIWAQTQLPLWIRRDKIDVFWSPRHHLPLLLDKQVVKVVTIHDLVWKKYPETMRPLNRAVDSLLMPLAVKAADRIIADSRSTARDLVDNFGPAREDIVVVPLASGMPDTDLLQPRALPELGINKDFILFVGTLEPRKNLKRLLQAYSSLPDDLLGKTQMVIAGGKGWGNDDLLETARQLNIASNIICLGYVDEGILASLYKKAIFLAMPSLYEGFGLPLLEAMSMGTPVLTANISSMPEVVGAAGYLVDPTDVAAIRAGLHLLLDDVKLRNRLAEKGKEQIRKFSWRKSARQTLAVLEEAARKKDLPNKIVN